MEPAIPLTANVLTVNVPAMQNVMVEPAVQQAYVFRPQETHAQMIWIVLTAKCASMTYAPL